MCDCRFATRRSGAKRRNAEPVTNPITLVLPEHLIDGLTGLLSCRARLGDFPHYLAGSYLVLGDAAGLAGIGVDYRWCAGLQLPCTAGCHQNVSVIAVETFDQLHWDVPLEN